MATIRSGILSKTSGSVAGVTAATWKGINYIREKVTPSNPNTAAQQEQRSKMKAVVAYSRGILGDWLDVYVDKFCKGYSAYNYYVKKNIGSISDGYLPDGAQVSFGSASIPSLTGTSSESAGNELVYSDAVITLGSGLSCELPYLSSGETGQLALILTCKTATSSIFYGFAASVTSSSTSVSFSVAGTALDTPSDWVGSLAWVVSDTSTGDILRLSDSLTSLDLA